jgi:predicted nucleic acid-binding protein
MNGVLADTSIAQQAIQLELPLFTLDKHFELITKVAPLRLWPRQPRFAMRKV